MAKRKKNSPTITAEEKLKEALIPEDEQPYEIPSNWCWVYLKKFATIRTGKKDANYGNDSGLYPFFTCAAEPIRCDSYSFDCKAILLAGNGDIGNINRFNGKFEAYQRTYVVEILNPINIDYCFYWFKFKWVKFNRDKMFGTAIPYIRLDNLHSFHIPIPPIEEQLRIVDRIESLFSKLDEAEEKLQSVLDSFETRKAAILHKAFTGRLTKKWRSDNGRDIAEWSKQRFNDVATIKSNLVDPASFPDFPHIAPDNIEKHTGQLLGYNTVSEDGVKSGKHHFYPGQILYSKIRPYLSKVIIAPVEGLCSADMYPIETPYNTRYLWYYMLSNEFLDQASFAGSRTVLPKINQKELSSLIVILPSSSEEQDEIVRLLDDFFSKEEQAKKLIESNLEQILFIRNAILTKAFHGELGTNNPNDEDAEELVKRILA